MGYDTYQEDWALLAIVLVILCFFAGIIFLATWSSRAVPLCPNCGQKMGLIQQVDGQKSASTEREYICPNESCRLYLFIHGSTYKTLISSEENWKLMIHQVKPREKDLAQRIRWVSPDAE